MNHKILLVNPAVTGEKEIYDYPIGLAYLAAALRSNGMQVEIIDLFYSDEEDTLLRKIFIEKPMIVGFTCTTPTFYDILTMAAKVKRICPITCVVLGGHHVTSIAEMILERYRQINCIILYEGEQTICQLSLALISENTDNIAKIDGIAYRFSDKNIYVNKTHNILNLDLYPLPAWDLIISPDDMTNYFHKKQASIITMRGCWGNCSFCDSRKVSRINYKDLVYVEKELIFLIKKYNVEYIYIQDLDFLKNKKRAVLISKLMKSNGIQEFQIVTRADSLVNSVDILETICNNGCSCIEVGIESGCHSQLDRYNKNVVVEVNIQALTILRSLNVRFSISFIMFDPFVTMKELMENCNFFIKNNIDTNDNERWLFSLTDLFPGTEMQKKAYENKLTYENGDNTNSLYYSFENDDVAFFYSYIYSFSKYIYPVVKKERETISRLINDELFTDMQKKIHLRSLYISIHAICFKFFNELLHTTPDNYNMIYEKYEKKAIDVNMVLENINGRGKNSNE